MGPYSSNVREEEKGSSAICLVGKTRDSTCCPRDSKDHYLYYEEQ